MNPSSVTIIGAGLMGQGIAVVFLGAGHDVTVMDTKQRLAWSESEIRRRVTESQSCDAPKDTGGTLTMTDSVQFAVSRAQYVIECLPEDVDLKNRVLTECNTHAPHDAVFLTNTSSVPLAELGRNLGSRQLIAAHFFNPAEIVPGVEIAMRDGTDNHAVISVEQLLQTAGKIPIRVAPASGYIGNRLQLALFREALLCVEEGLATPAEIDTIVKTTFGFRLPSYGPFEIADMAGLNVFAAILDNLRDAYGDRFSTPDDLTRRVARGETGMTSGNGYYSYDADDQPDALRKRDRLYRAVLAASADDTSATST